MNKINLLPIGERPSKWPINRLLLVAGFLGIMLFSSIYSYSMFKIWSMEGKLQNVRNQYQLLEPTRRMMVSGTTKQQQIDKKNNILSVLTVERHNLYGIIQHLTAITSPQIRFTDMVKSDKGAIQIKGWAVSYPAIAEFMQTIEGDQFFIESSLTNVERDNATKATKFEIVVKPRGI